MIAVRNLHKAYGAKTVLADVSCEFPAGRVTSLIGPNGAGKSTLLMLMARLQAPSQGQILLDGRDAGAIRIADYARRVATLRQSPGFNLRLTVDELVAFGRFPYSRGALTAQDRKAIDEAIAFLDLAPLRQSYLDELSGGQRQMAFLAMTIAQQTDVLLLDEPLNNLDMKHAVQIMRALRRLCDEQGRTVILVIHDINFAANYSDHIVALKHGALRFSGPVDEVVTEARLGELYELDFEIVPNGSGRLCNYFTPLEHERVLEDQAPGSGVGNGCGGHPGGLRRRPAEAPQAAQALAAPVTVKHQLGTTTVANVPRKVAVLDMNEADFLDQLGVPIAGMTKDYVPHFLSKYKDAPDVQDLGAIVQPTWNACTRSSPT